MNKLSFSLLICKVVRFLSQTGCALSIVQEWILVIKSVLDLTFKLKSQTLPLLVQETTWDHRVKPRKNIWHLACLSGIRFSNSVISWQFFPCRKTNWLPRSGSKNFLSVFIFRKIKWIVFYSILYWCLFKYEDKEASSSNSHLTLTLEWLFTAFRI